MGFNNIDAPGRAYDRRGVRTIQKIHGKAERLAAAQARRDVRRAKRASPDAIVFYPWPVDGVAFDEPEGAYCQGPNQADCYQVAVVGILKGTPEQYCDAVSRWTGKKLRVHSSEPMLAPPNMNDGMDDARAAGFARGFLNVILEPSA